MTHGRMLQRMVVIAVALLFAACASEGDEDAAVADDTTTTTTATDAFAGEESHCEDAFAEAARAGGDGTDEHLLSAAEACQSLDEWSMAAANHPEALGGADPEEAARRTCDEGAERLQTAPLCLSLEEG